MVFDARKGDHSDSFSPIPAGKYKVMLVKAEKKENDKGNKYLDCQFKVIGGDYAKRILFHHFNFQNSNQQSVDISEKQLRQFMLGAGVVKIKSVWDLSKLMNIPVEARVSIRKSKEYGDKNVIQAFTVPKDGESPSNEDDYPDTGKYDDEPWNRKKKKGKKKKGKKKKK